MITAARLESDRPGRARGALAAGLAGLAESGIIFLVLAAIARSSAVRGAGGPLGSYPVFLVIFTIGVATATAGRRSRWFIPATLVVATAVGILQALQFGSARASAVAFAVALSLGAALRAVMLALRDWRDPIQGSFGWGAGVLLVEILVADPAGWTSLLRFIVPVFFVASLASRAASLRLAEGSETVGRTSAPWFGLGATLVGVVGGLAVLAAVIGGQGGLLERLGRVIPLALSWIIISLTFVLAMVWKPIGWFLHLLGFERPNVERIFERFRRTAEGLGNSFSSPTHVGLVQRLLGLAVLVALIGLLVRLVVGQRRRWRERQRSLPELVEPRPAPEPPPRTRRKERARRRRELPEDTVRRWYAETLLELERRGVPKPAALTPGEYLQRAGEAYPASAGSLTALTRAYEDVRYGSRVISADRLGRLEAHRGVVLQTLRENG